MLTRPGDACKLPTERREAATGGAAMVRERPISLWETTSEERETGAPFEPGAHRDLAIVGGGYTGLSTALHAAEKGLSARVLEAERIGHGGSGRNVGLVNAGAWLPPAKVRAQLGETYGPRFVERFGDAPRLVFDLIEKHQIRCEATRSGTIHAAHAPSGFADLKSRHAEWQRLGAPVELLGPEEIAEHTGSRVFHGGLLDRRAGTVNPMGYCRGLARAAHAAGAEIQTGVRVTRLAREADRWRLVTDSGEMTATHVVLGTNAYTDALWPGLNRGHSTIHFLQLATEPLGPEAAHVLPGRQGLWDTGRIMLAYRRDAAGRLLIGTMGRLIGNAQEGITHRWAARQITRTFPELAGVRFEDAWHGRIAMTPEHLPRIHRLAEGLWTAIGYSGRGITTGTLFGMGLAELLTGADPADLPLPLSEPRRAPLAGLATRVYDLAFTANQVWKGL